MSNVVPFIFETKSIRSVASELGEPWFVLRDILEATQSKTKTTDAVRSIEQGLGEGFVNDVPLETQGGIQSITIIAEAAVTYLLSRSNTEPGRKLNRFIHLVVLPSIRRTGTYTKESEATALTPAPVQVLDAATHMVALARLFGLTGNQALLSADRATSTLTGVSPMKLLGATHLVSSVQERLLTVTELGKLLGLSAVATNKRLTAAGLQTAKRDMHGDLAYTPTEEGSRYGVFLDTNKKHGDGTPVQQVKWYASAAEKIADPACIEAKE